MLENSIFSIIIIIIHLMSSKFLFIFVSVIDNNNRQINNFQFEKVML